MPPPPSKPWYDHLTLDLIVNTLSFTFLSPFLTFILPLSLLAIGTPNTAPSVIITTIYCLSITFLSFLARLNNHIAYGPPRPIDLSEEVIVITGGASGLGLCIAEVYGMRGGTVAVMDVKKIDGAEGVRFYECDVGDRGQVERVWAKIVDDLGTPTILINNAAIMHGKPFLELTPEEVEKSFRVNTLSHYHLTSLFLPPLLSRPQGGTLITVSSVLAHLGPSHLSAYAATKSALTAFHSCLTAELAPHPNIKTILVSPGQLNTSLFEHVRLGRVRSFFGPVVEVAELAGKIMDMISRGEGGLISAPVYAREIGWLSVLPVGVQRLLRKWSGVDSAMAKLGGNRKDK